VGAGRLGRDEQVPGDLGVGTPDADEAEYLDLPVGKAVRRRVSGRPCLVVVPVEPHPSPMADLTDGVQQPLPGGGDAQPADQGRSHLARTALPYGHERREQPRAAGCRVRRGPCVGSSLPLSCLVENASASHGGGRPRVPGCCAALRGGPSSRTRVPPALRGGAVIAYVRGSRPASRGTAVLAYPGLARLASRPGSPRRRSVSDTPAETGRGGRVGGREGGK
jgi:hypothetical protein